MATTYDVRIWKTEQYTGKQVTTHRVVWVVAGKRWKQGFRTALAAESFRSELVTAVRRGEAFDLQTGRPRVAARDTQASISWFDFACAYVDMKWPTISGKYRRGIAEALTTLTTAMFLPGEEPDDPRLLRSALTNWAFNFRRRAETPTAKVAEMLSIAARRSRPLGDLTRPAVLRGVLNAAATRLDGKPAAGRTAHYKRVVLSNALSYAVELGYMEVNPVPSLKWKAPRTSRAIDRRVVANPDQARALLAAVAGLPKSGPRLEAFYASMYYSALRTEEAVNLRAHNLDLPESGFGWITLEGAAPENERHWTDSGTRRDERSLKHRAAGETRRVPCPPELVKILRAHLDAFGTDTDGRLFRGLHGDPLSSATYLPVWKRARKAALTPEQCASPLAKRPYDLRHAAVSTWLNAGVPPTQVAEWAGHSVAVLYAIYAKCLDGQEELALRQVSEALRNGRDGGRSPVPADG